MKNTTVRKDELRRMEKAAAYAITRTTIEKKKISGGGRHNWDDRILDTKKLKFLQSDNHISWTRQSLPN